MGQDEDTIEAAVETHLDHAEWPIVTTPDH